MPTKATLDHRAGRVAVTSKIPAVLKRQVDEYASKVGIPINSAMILLLDRSLQAAGYPGVSGPSPGTTSRVTPHLS